MLPPRTGDGVVEIAMAATRSFEPDSVQREPASGLLEQGPRFLRSTVVRRSQLDANLERARQQCLGRAVISASEQRARVQMQRPITASIGP